MAFWDGAKVLDEVMRSVHLLQERHDNYEKTFTALRNENAKLREEVASLTTRVSVLEEARKTTAAEVKVAMTEVLSRWEKQQLQEKLEAAQAEAKRLSAKE